MNGTFDYIRAVAVSDTGRRREHNEDAAWAIPEAGLFGVADGVGGSEGGEWASQGLRDRLQALAATEEFRQGDFSSRLSQVRRAVRDMRVWIRLTSEARGVRGMATTVVLLVCDPNRPSRARALHAGDSRLYLLRGGELRQLTRDHSVAEASGRAEDTLPRMFRGVITRAVNADLAQKLEETRVGLATGDCLLLCSDGLTKMIKDDDIQRMLVKSEKASLDARATLLVESANRAGGLDNITVVLACFDQIATPPEEDESPTVDPEDVAEVSPTPTGPEPTPSTASGQTMQGSKPPPHRRPRVRHMGGTWGALAVLLAVGLIWMIHPSGLIPSETPANQDSGARPEKPDDTANPASSANASGPESPRVPPVPPTPPVPPDPENPVETPAVPPVSPGSTPSAPPAPEEKDPTPPAPGPGIATAPPAEPPVPVPPHPSEDELKAKAEEQLRQDRIQLVKTAIAAAATTGNWGSLDKTERDLSGASLNEYIEDASERARVAVWRQTWKQASEQYAQGRNPARERWNRAVNALQPGTAVDQSPFATASDAGQYCRGRSEHYRLIRVACEARQSAIRLRWDAFYSTVSDEMLGQSLKFMNDESGNDIIPLAQSAQKIIRKAVDIKLDSAPSDLPTQSDADGMLQAIEDVRAAENLLWKSLREHFDSGKIQRASRNHPGSQELLRPYIYGIGPDACPDTAQLGRWQKIFEIMAKYAKPAASAPASGE